MADAVHPHVFQQQARKGELIYLGLERDLNGYVIVDVFISDQVSQGQATRRMSVSHLAPDGTMGVVTLINPVISDKDGVLTAMGDNRIAFRAMQMGPLFICTGCDSCRQ
jgi:hypothetical protein